LNFRFSIFDFRLADDSLPRDPCHMPQGPSDGRLMSLDVFRGFIMFWIVGGAAVVVKGFELIGDNPVTKLIAEQLKHSDWQGCTFEDLIWPSFMLIVGISLPFAFAKRVKLGQSYSTMFFHAAKRSVILFLLGSLRESVSEHQPYLIELSSALQPIAIAYFVSFLLLRKSVKVQAIVAGSILLGYWLILAFVPAPGIEAGSLIKDSNLVTAIDVMILGRSHPDGWGTVLCTIPTISTTLFGVMAGELLRSGRTSKNKMTIFGIAGTCGVLIGLGLHYFLLPSIMKLWTSSYGILSAGWACLMFLFFYWVVDVRGFRKWGFGFMVIGVNAIAIYMGVSLFGSNISGMLKIFIGGTVRLLGAVGPLFEALCIFLVRFSILFWMYRRKIFIKV